MIKAKANDDQVREIWNFDRKQKISDVINTDAIELPLLEDLGEDAVNTLVDMFGKSKLIKWCAEHQSTVSSLDTVEELANFFANIPQ